MKEFDVSWDLLAYIIAKDNGALYYSEDDESFKLYYVQNNGVCLHYQYLKQGTEQDLIWKDDHLKNAVRVIRPRKNDLKLRIKTEEEY